MSTPAAGTATVHAESIARVYLKSRTPEMVAVQIPRTKYELHLRPVGEVRPTPQGRVRGVIRCRVWKVDFISAGGAFIEPLVGRPRRVQGTVIASLPESNSVVVEVMDQPIVGDLPPRWQAADIEVGTRVGLDVYDGAEFHAAAE